MANNGASGQGSALRVTDLGWVGSGLHRPECVLCTARGDVWCADWRGGVARIAADGAQSLVAAAVSQGEAPLRPNGIALLADGSFLLADISDRRAGIWRLWPTGEVEPFLLQVDGVPLPPANFVTTDEQGRVWITVSTRLQPRALDYRPDAHSGFVVLVDGRGARVVADGLGYVNECRLSAAGDHLYLNETFARRLSRFRVAADGSLGPRETVTSFGLGTFPDGLALDEEGGVWIASIVSNRVIRVAPDGTQQLVLEDSDPKHLDWVERAFQGGTMGREHLDSLPEGRLRSISSLAFGGPDRRTVHLGCLLGNRIATFRSPVAGLRPVHWNVNLSVPTP